MLKSNEELIAELKAVLASQRYHSRAISNYCGCACRFLDYLERWEIQVEDVTEVLVIAAPWRMRSMTSSAVSNTLAASLAFAAAQHLVQNTAAHFSLISDFSFVFVLCRSNPSLVGAVKRLCWLEFAPRAWLLLSQ